MDALIRLRNEYKNIQQNLHFGCYINPNQTNWFKWTGQIHSKGVFYEIELNFNKNYPNSPPTARFISKVFNPNVYTNGSVCLDIISSKWSPSLTIADILQGLICLLEYPNPNSPANAMAGQLFAKDKTKYYERVAAVNEANKKYKLINFIE